MNKKKFRWSKVYESSEEELVDLLKARKLEAERVHAESGAEQAEQRTQSAVTVWCAEGSLAILEGSGSTSLQAGDALRLGANVAYAVHPGIADCVYYLTA